MGVLRTGFELAMPGSFNEPPGSDRRVNYVSNKARARQAVQRTNPHEQRDNHQKAYDAPNN
jgi:hypothetical protein